jgi:dethiobiotin synthetase
VQSGCPEQGGRLLATDAQVARDLAGLDEPLELLTPITLRLPLAPGVAAPREGTAVDLGKIARAYRTLARRHDCLVVEGAGGLYVPLVGTKFLVLDMIRWIKLPLVVVARAGLGTINHTVLTVNAARQFGVPVAGIILNQYPEKPSLAEKTNPEVIEDLTGAPILGRVPRVADLESPEGRDTFLAAMDGVCRNLAQAAPALGFLQIETSGKSG